MLELSANLSTMFTDLPMVSRFEAAHACGFERVEIQYPYAMSSEEIAEQLSRHGLKLVLINVPAGERPGDKGLASLPDRIDDFRQSFDRALTYASRLDVHLIHVLLGVGGSNSSRADHLETAVFNLHWATTLAARHDVTLVIEALNPSDVPGYFLRSLSDARELVGLVPSDRLRLLFDTYHCARSGGEPATDLEHYADITAHVQVADFPGRGAPGTGSIDWMRFRAALKRSKYAGVVGCEYLQSGLVDPQNEWSAALLLKERNSTTERADP